MPERLTPKPEEVRTLTLREASESIRILQRYSDQMPQGSSEVLQKQIAAAYLGPRIEAVIERQLGRITQILFEVEKNPTE